ncbi:MAG: murein biosynthesis integral membrane protein MurJ [Candidatus Taylorbacteria bacterium]|nr:murein biosynthesis integral membrane protein MurJ [Candidatus Taylorbacteria bacterium]
MVKRVLTMLNKEISGLHEAAYLLGAFALGSQLLALFRDRLFASTFGASRTLDLYYAAFRIPDFIFVSIASMVSVSVLVPFFIKKIKSGEEEGKRFIDNTFSIFFVAIILVSLVVFICIPYLVPYLFPGLSGDIVQGRLATLARIMLLSPILLGISNFFASITQIYNRFFIYALSPLLYNVGIIMGVLVFYPAWGIVGLAWGVVLGAFLHVVVQVPFIREKKLFPQFRFPFDFSSIRNIVLTSLPRTLTLSANQIALFFLVAFASLMGAGSIAVFNFSWNLQSVPLSIVGASYASAVFPALSRYIIEGRHDKFFTDIVMAARHIIFWSLPLMTLFVVLRAQIVRTILGAGHFSWSDTRLTAACLAIFLLSVVPQSLLLLFIRGYYALGKTYKPLLINVVSAVCIVVLGYVFIQWYNSSIYFRYFLESLFKVENVSGSIILVLPLAYTIGTTINALWHFVAFQYEFKTFSHLIGRTFFASFSASVIAGYVAHLFLSVFDDVFNINTFSGIFLQGLCSGVLGIVAGVIILLLLKNQEIKDVWRTLHEKFWKAKVMGADSVEPAR